MEENRMELLNFLNELFTMHRDIEEKVVLCYNMHNSTLFYEDNKNGIRSEIVAPEYKDKPKEVELAYNEFFVEGADKKSVECFYSHGIYFLPGKEEGSIVFGKDYFTVHDSGKTLKGIDVVNVSFEDLILKEKISETPVCDVDEKEGGNVWQSLLVMIILFIIIWYMFF